MARNNLGDRLSVWSLEDLTTQVSSMKQLYEKFGIEKTDKEILKLQKTDINRKVKNRKVDSIVEAWPPELKKTFILICGETMMYHGYEKSLEAMKETKTT